MLNYFKALYEHNTNCKLRQLTTEQLKSEMEIILKMAGLDSLYEIVDNEEYSIALPIYNPKELRFSWAAAGYILKRDTELGMRDDFASHVLYQYETKGLWGALDAFDAFIFDLIGG